MNYNQTTKHTMKRTKNDVCCLLLYVLVCISIYHLFYANPNIIPFPVVTLTFLTCPGSCCCIHSASPVLGDLSFSLNEIIKCLACPPLNTPTLGQTVFDEIGTLFAGALLREMELDYAPVVRDLIWQEMLMAKPLNVITWPFIARCLLLVMRQCFQHSEALFVFHSPATEEDAMMQDEIFCLTFTHPLITDFLFEAGVATDDGSTPIAPNAFAQPRKTVAELKLKYPSDPNILRVSPNGRSLFSIRYKVTTRTHLYPTQPCPTPFSCSLLRNGTLILTSSCFLVAVAL